MYAETSKQELERFGVGQRLGDCLLKGCVVFIGNVESLGPVQKVPPDEDDERAMKTRNVNVKVAQWLYGAGIGNPMVQLLYAEEPEVSKTGTGPWVPWQGVNPEAGSQLLVVRWAKDAPRPSWLGKPDDLALVTADKTLFGPARDAVTQHRRLERHPDDATEIPKLLRVSQENVVRGYLLAYLMDGEGVRNVDRAGAMLSGLLTAEWLPEPAREQVADWLASNFYQLNDATRKGVVRTIVAPAAGNDPTNGTLAISVLVRLGDQQLLDLKPVLTDANRGKIAENYRAYQTQKKDQQAHPGIERQLALDR
jgi:hypothetical protein